MTLPDVAQRKLASLTQQASDARALAHSAKDRASVLETKGLQLQNGHASGAEISKVAEEYERARDLQMQRYRHWQDCEQLCARLQSWVRELPSGTVLEPAPAPLVGVTNQPGLAVAQIRSEISALATEFHRLTVAAPNRDDAKAQIRSLVQSLATKGRPRIDVQRGEVRVSGWMGDGSGYPVAHSVTVQTLCWAVPDLMIATLEGELETIPVDAHALPLDQRKERLAEIADEIALLENREEAMLERAHQDGVQIERRHDRSAGSILNVRITAASARAAA